MDNMDGSHKRKGTPVQNRRSGSKLFIALGILAFTMLWLDMFSPKPTIDSAMLEVVNWSKSDETALNQPQQVKPIRRRIGDKTKSDLVRPQEQTPPSQFEDRDDSDEALDEDGKEEGVKDGAESEKETAASESLESDGDQRSQSKGMSNEQDTTAQDEQTEEDASGINTEQSYGASTKTKDAEGAPEDKEQEERTNGETAKPEITQNEEDQTQQAPEASSDGKKRISLEEFERITRKAIISVHEQHAAAAKRVQLRDNMDPQRDLPVHPDAVVEHHEGGCSNEQKIHIVWAYSSSLAEPSYVMDFGQRRKHFYCGNSECMALQKMPCVSVERLVLTEFFRDSPFSEWIGNHPIQKLLNGNKFEDMIQIMVQLLVAYRTGALVTQPGTLVPTEEEAQQKDGWIGTKTTCGDGAISETGGLLALQTSQGSPAILKLMQSFIQNEGASWNSLFQKADCNLFLQVDVVSPMVTRRNQRYAALSDQSLAFSLLHFPRIDTILNSIDDKVSAPTLAIVSGQHVFANVSDNLHPLFFGVQWNNDSALDSEFMSQQWPIGVDTAKTQFFLKSERVDSFVTHGLSRLLPCSRESRAAFELLQQNPRYGSLKGVADKVLKQLTASCEVTQKGRRLTSSANESNIAGWDLSRIQHSEGEDGVTNRLKVLTFCQPSVLDASIKFGMAGSEWKFLFDEHYAACPEPKTDPSMPRVAMVVDLNLMKQDEVFATFINSLATNHKTPLIMYILTTNLDTAQRCMVRYLVGQPLHKDSRVHVLAVDHELHQFAEHYTGLTHISLATQSRLLLPRLLPCVPKVLWLDADTIVMRSLTELWSTVSPTTACGVAGRPSYSNYVYWQVKGTQAYVENVRKIYTLKKTSAKGFNAGVVILDLDNLRKNKIYNRTIHEAAIKYGNDDQVALNLACNGSFTELPQIWNMFHYSGAVDDIRDPAFDRPLSEWGILHWTSSNKPWAKKSYGFKDSKAQLIWSLYKRKFSEAIACPPEEKCTMSDTDNSALRAIISEQTPFPTAAPTSPTPTSKPGKETDNGSCMYLPFGGELVTVWSYNSAPMYSEKSFPNYKAVWKRVVCRVEACVKMIQSLNVPCLRVSLWTTKDLVSGTIMESWFEKNSDVALEGQIQVMSQLVYLYKFGGIITKAGVRLPSPLPAEWIGAKELKDGESLDKEGNKCVKEVVPNVAFLSPVGIGAMGAPEKSDFILSILKSFIKMYKREAQRKIVWPTFFQSIDCFRWRLIGLT